MIDLELSYFLICLFFLLFSSIAFFGSLVLGTWFCFLYSWFFICLLLLISYFDPSNFYIYIGYVFLFLFLILINLFDYCRKFSIFKRWKKNIRMRLKR